MVKFAFPELLIFQEVQLNPSLAFEGVSSCCVKRKGDCKKNHCESMVVPSVSPVSAVLILRVQNIDYHFPAAVK